MPNVTIKYVNAYKDRHGLERIQYRRKGFKKAPLRGPIGSPEFWEDYQAASKGQATFTQKQKPLAPVVEAAIPHSLFWLFTEYKKSATYTILGIPTRNRRSKILDDLGAIHGSKGFAQMRPLDVRKIRDKYHAEGRDHGSVLKALKGVFKFAIDDELLAVDPTRDIPYLKSQNPDGHHTWSIDEVELFEDTHPIGTKARLALAIMLYAGCARSSDAFRLGRQHLTKDGRIKYIQYKGRHKSPSHINIIVLPEFRAILDASPTGDLTFLVTAFDRPFNTTNGFYNWFKKRCKEAGLPHCSAHGVRKAAAVRLAESGCSTREIMEMGGWKTMKEVEHYTKEARKKVLADNATLKLMAGQKSNKSD